VPTIFEKILSSIHHHHQHQFGFAFIIIHDSINKLPEANESRNNLFEYLLGNNLKQKKWGQMEKGKMPDGNGADHQFKAIF
jgi:hypothetical protein